MIIAGDMPVIASISRLPHPASRSFSAERRRPGAPRRRQGRDPRKGILLTMTHSIPSTVTPASRKAEQAIDALLHPVRLYGATDCLCRPSPIPTAPGVYAWYFDEVPPGVPFLGCHRALGHTLLYVGIAPKEAKGRAAKPSIRTLRQRMRDHFNGNAEGSTLRLTLGCLLSETLNIRLRRVGSGRRHTFTNPGEIALDTWMTRHARDRLGRS